VIRLIARHGGFMGVSIMVMRKGGTNADQWEIAATVAGNIGAL
jgi:hypothetical protein